MMVTLLMAGISALDSSVLIKTLGTDRIDKSFDHIL
jgi:hypothetical protein